MILYRSVGLQELALIYDSGMKAFPARLPQQPIFYPVLQLEYARQIASDWNVESGQLAGYVTQFKVEDEYIGQYREHTVGGSQHQEFWIPAEKLEEFNQHISGHIKVVEAYFGDGFQGFVPNKFGLQGKNAVDQFTLLANIFVYKRMDFYLEIKRNHKAIFLNYLFWHTHHFKNPGLKEKVLQGIKEAWLTSFPQIPLPVPPPASEDAPPAKQIEFPAQQSVDPDEEDTPVEETDSHSLVKPVRQGFKPVKPIRSHALEKHAPEKITPVVQPPTPQPSPVEEETTSAEETDSSLVDDPVQEEITPVEEADSPVLSNPVQEGATLPLQLDSHFVQGIRLGLSGSYHEATGELLRAIEEDPQDVVAHTSLGVAFHRLGQDGRAQDSYETALKIDPIHAEAHYFRANILYARGNGREAIAGYTIAVGLQPELIEAHRNPLPEDRLTDYTSSLAEMHWIARPARRILDLNKMLEADPGQASLFKERAAEYYRLRNYAQSIADYSSALALQPADASALHLRGIAYEQLGQTDRAAEDYQKANALNPQLSNMYIDRGVAFGRIGNYQQSIASLTDSIRLAPQNADTYFNRGIAYFQLGEFESAMTDFSRVIQLSANDEEAYYWRGMANEQAGRTRDAAVDYRQFLRLSKNPHARQEIEQKLRQWNEEKQKRVSSRNIVPDPARKTTQAPPQKREQKPDLYDLLIALGERALNSTWFGSGVNCYGEAAEELLSLTGYNQPIQGQDLLRIASGIEQTLEGDFQAFDPGAPSHWIFIRAAQGSGFYMEINDPKIRERLKPHFPAVEDLDGATAPYVWLFIRIE